MADGRSAPPPPDGHWSGRASALPTCGGAYVLWIELSRTVSLPARFHGRVLGPGCYLYAGSAYGPGGIRARAARHLKRRKRRRWHVDWLTTRARVVRVLPLPSATECDVIRTLSSRHMLHTPLAGFGSTDCPLCPAHLAEITLPMNDITALLMTLPARAGAP